MGKKDDNLNFAGTDVLELEAPAPKKKKNNKSEDIILVNNALNNKCNFAFGKLFTRYQKGIQFTIFQMVNNLEDAEDLTIEAFSKAFKNLSKYNQSNAFSTWLYRIAVNHTIDFIRKRRLETVSIDDKKFSENDNITFADDLVSDTLDPELMLISSQKAQAIENIIDKLTPNYQALINYRFKENLPYKEIAKKLGVELGTVKGQLSRARKLLIAILKGKKGINDDF